MRLLQTATSACVSTDLRIRDWRGMGTTVRRIALVGHTLHLRACGDTRLYLVRDGQITTITRDHSYVGRLVESGVIARDLRDLPVADQIQPRVPHMHVVQRVPTERSRYRLFPSRAIADA